MGSRSMIACAKRRTAPDSTTSQHFCNGVRIPIMLRISSFSRGIFSPHFSVEWVSDLQSDNLVFDRCRDKQQCRADTATKCLVAVPPGSALCFGLSDQPVAERFERGALRHRLRADEIVMARTCMRVAER